MAKPNMVFNHSLEEGNKMGTRAREPLPVTLLSGFLGAGKTTLLQHVLEMEHGLRIAVVVNDIGAVNVDANLIKGHNVAKTEEKVIAMQNGCICCTLRGDLLEELVNLSKMNKFDYIIIESSGISEPEQVAETFDIRLGDQMSLQASEGGMDEATIEALKEIQASGGLEKFAKLDTAVTVIDAFTMFHDFDTADLLSSRREDVTEEDERTVSDLMVDQIEFADVIVLNKIDMVDEKKKVDLLQVIVSLNPKAKIIETVKGKVNPREIVNTNLFNLEVARTSPGWLQDLHAMTAREVNGRKVITPKPETEEYSVRNFVYVRWRPFHPQRLWELLYDKFILQLEHDAEDEQDVNGDGDDQSESAPSSHAESTEEEDDDSECCAPDPDTILANKRSHPVFKDLLRSKGGFWFASRPDYRGEWSQAGAMLRMTGEMPFFCTLDPGDYLGEDSEVNELLKHDIDMGGDWGDRRQEIVFIGLQLQREKISDMLDECLLNNKEWEDWQSIMRDNSLDEEQKIDALNDRFEDGWPDWPAFGHDHNHDHDHDDGNGDNADDDELEEAS